MVPYIIGIDIGTSGVKAVAFTFGGEVLADAHLSYSPLPSSPGYHELDPVALLQAVLKTMKAAISKTKQMPGLSGLSFSCAMHSLMIVDKDGLPLTNAITWADTRSKEVAAAIKNTPAGNRIYEHTGTPIHAMSPLCKIIWFKDNEPDVFAKAYKFIGIKEYIWHYFFENYCIDYSIASATGLFNIYEFAWDKEALSLAGINAEHLSTALPTTHIENNIPAKLQQELGLSGSIPFIIGASDGCLANLGSNAVNPGEASLTIGTSGALRMTSAAPQHDPKQRIFNYILTENIYISGGAVNNGAVVVQWFFENFINKTSVVPKDFSHAMEEAGAIAAGSGGLIFLPYLLGERAPVWDAGARGVFFGINTQHTESHFMRAVVEGVSFSLYQVGVSLEETIGPIQQVYVSGGFIQSPFWVQLIADIFNKKVLVTNAADASAIGAAMLGFTACGLVGDIAALQQMTSIHHVIEPDVERHAVYQENFLIFSGLYEQLKTSFEEVSALQAKRGMLR